MAAPSMTISTAILLFLLLPAISATRSNPNPNNTNSDYIRTECASKYEPGLCYDSLIAHANEVQGDPAKLTVVAVRVSFSSARKTMAYISNLSRKPNPDKVLKVCVSSFGDAIYQMQRSTRAMNHENFINDESMSHRLFNVTTWLGAAVNSQRTCVDEFGSVKSDVYDRVVYVQKLTSQAIGFINWYLEGAVQMD
ncbi:pectinesterase inhibitor 10-like [Telopea speciosissima]|uniref:pectinesterase inhibitor 10-like n=1 Tax=Telopea speciosissima TaxID=54955 RepID=UPI001CC52D5F|nr:pectinesterase inhibitor 10-like [Telopea speciosissima]